MTTSVGLLRITIVILSIEIGLLAVSCSSSSSTTRFLVNQPDRTVGMEITYREGSPEYSHPRNLSPGVLEQALSSIEVQPSSLLDRIAGASSHTQEAFTKEQREFLAHQLSAALQKATPLETVTFSWATPRGNGIWELTSGGTYIQGSDLHLILPNYRQTVSAKNPHQRLRNQPLSQLGEPLHSLKAVDRTRQLTQNLVTELWAPQTPHFVFSLKEWANPPLTSTEQQLQQSTSQHKSWKSIKQRLQRLEVLRQEGLLSEKEYQLKRQEILGKL